MIWKKKLSGFLQMILLTDEPAEVANDTTIALSVDAIVCLFTEQCWEIPNYRLTGYRWISMMKPQKLKIMRYMYVEFLLDSNFYQEFGCVN